MCLVGNKRAEIARVVPCENNFCTKYAHHLHFCGLQKLNTLNLRHFHLPLNTCNNFSTVLIKTNWYTISCKYSNCRLLEEINIPNGVEAIKVSAFVCCDKLENISLPVSVKQIEMHAFAGSGLKTIKLFGEVTSIKEYAFADCRFLTDFYCYSDNSPQTAENVFVKVDLNKVNLHVPCNRKDAYTGADYWRDFGHIFTTDEVKQDGLWYRLDDNTLEAAIINNPDGNSRIIYEGDIVIPTDIGFSHANYDVTSIGVRAFEYSNIQISLPSPSLNQWFRLERVLSLVAPSQASTFPIL